MASMCPYPNVFRLARRAVPILGLGLVLTFFLLMGAGSDVSAFTTRQYWMAADEVAWDYAPLGFNNITGEDFEEANVFVGAGEDRIGRVYTKALYREYLPPGECGGVEFGCLKPIPPEWQHLGTLGPVLRGEVGDTIVVHFKNNARFDFSVHPHGVFYDKTSEGAPYNDGDSQKADDIVPPGGTHTYTWEIPERAGPGPMDGSSVLWMYHSHVDEPGDTNAGLIGPIIVTRAGMARADGSPVDVDREFVTMFTVFDENRSVYIDQNIQTRVPGGDKRNFKGELLKEDEEFIESNLMHSINGFVFGNTPGLVMNTGETVRWYELGMGTEVDLHTPHWHGQTLTWNGMRTDVIELMPGSMKTLDMLPDDPGTWLFHCHVNDHIDAGMMALVTVSP